MKGFSSKVCLVGVMCVVLGVSFGDALNIGNMINSLENENERHAVRFHSLYLGSDGEAGFIVQNQELHIINGLVVGNQNNKSDSAASILGGGKNSIGSSSNSIIAGGEGNIINNGENAVIGGGSGNNAMGNNSVIVGGYNNTVAGDGIVAGGESNYAADNGVALGGMGNHSESGSLVLGENAKGVGGVFTWNAILSGNNSEEGRIDAKNGVLIGATEGITGVSLVVNGAIKIAGNLETGGVAGEIRYISGCFYANDGRTWYVVNQLSGDVCEWNGSHLAKTCRFGNVQLQEGDIVEAYSKNFSSNCDSVKKIVVCTNGELLVQGTSEKGYEIPYCYGGHNATNTGCSYNGISYSDGASISAYTGNSVSCGQSCSTTIFTCNNGNWQRDGVDVTPYAECSAACNSCSFNGSAYSHNQTIEAYSTGSVSCGNSCPAKVTFKCNNGSWQYNGSNKTPYASCTVSSCGCAFNGKTYSHGETVSASNVECVSNSSSCPSYTFICNDGDWQRNGVNETPLKCTKASSSQVCAPCGGPLSDGGSRTCYKPSASCDGTCSSQKYTVTSSKKCSGLSWGSSCWGSWTYTYSLSPSSDSSYKYTSCPTDICSD